MANTIRNEVLAIDRDQAVSDVHTMEEVIEESVGQRRLTMVLVGLFASVALLLSVVGIYGLVALCLAKRSYTCEINDLEYSLIRSFPLKFLP